MSALSVLHDKISRYSRAGGEFSLKAHQLVLNSILSPVFIPVNEIQMGRLAGFDIRVKLGEYDERLSLQSLFASIQNDKLLSAITTWLIVSVCRKYLRLRNSGCIYSDSFITLSLIPQHFWDIKLLHSIVEVLRKFKLSPGLFQVNIMAREIDKNLSIMHKSLAWLKRIGFRVAVEDFGDGGVTFKELHELHIDMLYLSQSYTRNLSYATDKSILIAILNLANRVNLKTIVRGLGTKNDLTILREIAQHFKRKSIYILNEGERGV